MKKLLTMAAGLVLATSAFAADLPEYSTLQITTEGPDRYADGTDVLPGETYLLVYMQPGVTTDMFPGVRPDGTLVNSASNRIVGTSVAIAGDHGTKCSDKQFQYLSATYANGTWIIVLLDTRKGNEQLGGLVSGYSIVNDRVSCSADKATCTLTVRAQSGAGLTAITDTVPPGNLPTPVITAVARNNDSADIRFKGFADGVIYEVHSLTNLTSGGWVKATPKTAISQISAKALGVEPGPAAELPVSVSVPANDDTRFFKVIVKGN